MPGPGSVNPKAREARMARLNQMLDTGLDAPAALELLVSEVQAGDSHPALWERLHAAADRDDKVFELASAYHQLAHGKRLAPLEPAKQVEILMHGADFLQGLLGDGDAATELLERILAVVPDHAEVFSRLERRFTDSKNNRRLAELYARAASARPEKSVLLLGRALMLIEVLPAQESIGTDVCEALLGAASVNARVFAVLESHCKKTGRVGLACRLLERAIAEGGLEVAKKLELRRRLVTLYVFDAKTPAEAMGHVEEVLEREPADVAVRTAAEQLLKVPSVATRAAAALQGARRRTRPSSFPPRSS